MKYSKMNPNPKFKDGENPLIFTLKFVIVEIPFATIRTLKCMARIVSLSKKDVLLYMTVCSIISLVLLAMVLFFKNWFSGFIVNVSLAVPLVIFTSISILVKVKYADESDGTARDKIKSKLSQKMKYKDGEQEQGYGQEQEQEQHTNSVTSNNSEENISDSIDDYLSSVTDSLSDDLIDVSQKQNTEPQPTFQMFSAVDEGDLDFESLRDFKTKSLNSLNNGDFTNMNKSIQDFILNSDGTAQDFNSLEAFAMHSLYENQSNYEIEEMIL